MENLWILSYCKIYRFLVRNRQNAKTGLESPAELLENITMNLDILAMKTL